MVTLCELRDQITEDQITQGEVMAALREPLAGTDDGYVRSKLKQAITSANIYYSSRKWGQCRTMERAKARLIADIAKARGYRDATPSRRLLFDQTAASSMLASIARIHWRHGCPICSVATRSQAPSRTAARQRRGALRRRRGPSYPVSAARRTVAYCE